MNEWIAKNRQKKWIQLYIGKIKNKNWKWRMKSKYIKKINKIDKISRTKSKINNLTCSYSSTYAHNVI